MNFFETLSATGINEVNIQVKHFGKEIITVFLTPKYVSEVDALKEIKSIYLTGTPKEIDAQFFALVSTPLKNIQKVISNVEEFEAKTEEIAKAIAENKAFKSEAKEEKPEVAKKEKLVAKEVKVNNEKVLKDFVTSVKADPILNHKETIEKLYALLTVEELDKPFPKKVRIDLDIAIRKQEQIDAARAKFNTANSTEEVPETMTELVPDEPQPFETVDKAEEAFYANMEIVKGEASEIEVVAPEIITSNPVVAPVVAKSIIEEYEDVTTMEMISTQGSYEDYVQAGWNDDQLIQHGHAKAVVKRRLITPSVTAQKLSYKFPEPFDAEDQDNS